MSLRKLTSKVTYKVPAWSHCNMQGNKLGRPSKDKCRFCVKEKGYYRCALYNDVLSTSGALIDKTRACEKATAGFESVVEDEAPVQVDPKELIKTTIAEYNKVRSKFISQGYPSALAERLATNHLIGGE